MSWWRQDSCFAIKMEFMLPFKIYTRRDNSRNVIDWHNWLAGKRWLIELKLHRKAIDIPWLSGWFRDTGCQCVKCERHAIPESKLHHQNKLSEFPLQLFDIHQRDRNLQSTERLLAFDMNFGVLSTHEFTKYRITLYNDHKYGNARRKANSDRAATILHLLSRVASFI